MEKPIIYDIQNYSIHDGDGIRTTVFFKGCPLHCGWCHNPESQNFNCELMFNGEKCTGCGTCLKVCPNGAVTIKNGVAATDRLKCALCEKCVDCCLNGARETAGRTYMVDELVSVVLKDSVFYEQSGGGVTLSGGEVMAQPFDYIEKLVSSLYEKGYSVYIDTCGFAPYERFSKILPYVDTFLYDIKEMDTERHEHFTGKPNGLILENLKKLSDDGARIYLRLPLIGNVNANDDFIKAVVKFLKSGVRIEQVNLLPYHNIGKSKYSRLDREYDSEEIFKVPSDELLNHFAQIFRENGYSRVKIGG